MAKDKVEKLNVLTDEQRQKLISLDKQIAESEKRIALLKKMGLGTRELEDKLEWAKMRLAILLEEG